MEWLKASLFSQAILALYFQVVQWLPLGRWNYQPGFTPFGVQVMHGDASGQDFLLLVAFVLPFLAFWVAYSNDLRWLMWLGVVGYGLWLALQIKTWWIAYAFGASDSWLRVYQRTFRHSTQLLPSFGRHLPPDGLHLVLHVLLATVVALTVVGLLKTGRADSSRGR